MHDREWEHANGGSLRPRTTRLEDPESALQMRAVLSGRLDAVTSQGVLGLQRAIGNAGTAALLEEKCSSVHDIASGPGGLLTHDAVVHDLTRAVQKGNGPIDGTLAAGGISVTDPSDQFKRKATTEHVMTAPAASTLPPASAQLQRQTVDEAAEEEPVQGSFVQRTNGEEREEPHNAAVATLLKPIQRSTCGPGCGCGPCAEETTTPGLSVQRHQGVDSFQEKPGLESTELGSVPDLQVAVSSAAQALEVGRHSGGGVARLQEVLRSKGYAAPSSGVYDRATQHAVAKFQADHGIPFPTGRQAGPKTLSTLDDHLLPKKSPPTPGPKCNQYAPGEHARSRSSPGTSRRLGTFGKELELLNYGANQERLKPEHQAALKKLVDDFALFDPCTDFKVDKIIGFTDSVDREELNEQLRLGRANIVAGFLQTNGVPGAPDGLAADPATYDPGCDPLARSEARRVAIRLVKRPKSETDKCRDKPQPPVPPQGCKKDQASETWSLQSTFAGSLTKGVAVATMNYILTDTSPGGCKHILEFTGVGIGVGVSFPATVSVSGATPFKVKGGPILPTDFTRAGRIILAEAGAGGGFGFQFARFVGLSTDPEPVDLSGVQLGAGADAMVLVGAWTLLPF